MAYDTAAVVCGDLRALVAQIRVLHWAMDNLKHFATLHHINTKMAFLEGIFAEWLSSSPGQERGCEPCE